MAMYSFRPRGVCSQEMHVEIDSQGIIQELQVVGGCNGNLKGISALVKGMSAKEAVQRLRGIPAPISLRKVWSRCWPRSSSRRSYENCFGHRPV